MCSCDNQLPCNVAILQAEIECGNARACVNDAAKEMPLGITTAPAFALARAVLTPQC